MWPTAAWIWSRRNSKNPNVVKSNPNLVEPNLNLTAQNWPNPACFWQANRKQPGFGRDQPTCPKLAGRAQNLGEPRPNEVKDTKPSHKRVIYVSSSCLCSRIGRFERQVGRSRRVGLTNPILPESRPNVVAPSQAWPTRAEIRPIRTQHVVLFVQITTMLAEPAQFRPIPSQILSRRISWSNRV